MTHSLHALVIKLIAQNDGTLNSPVGELGPAAFYAAVRAVDPDLAAHLHDAQERKDFSLSPLYGYWRSPADKLIHIRAGQEGWLRLGLVDARLFAVFMQHLLNPKSQVQPLSETSTEHGLLTARLSSPKSPDAGRMTFSTPSIRLGAVHFAICEVLGTPLSHAWAGYTTLADLQALQPTSRSWTLFFESPTVIRWGEADNGVRRVEVFPQPRMAIAGLRTRWDKLTGEEWGRDFEDWVERNVIIGRVWHWETQTFAYQKQGYIGGQGKIEYRVLDDSKLEYVAHLNRLLHFAFYTGIGYKTTHGLGQVRVNSQ